jgi:phosphoribosyl 1,2-cyclic phosphodiesterase
MVKFCSLFSGSSGNSLLLMSENTKILIDAGLSAKRIVAALAAINEKPSDIAAILVSHEHSDHSKGVGILSRKYNIPIYANMTTWHEMSRIIGEVLPQNTKYFEYNESFFIGDIEVKPFPIPHDAVMPAGFSIFAEGNKVTIATDIGHMTNSLLESFEGSDLLFLESNHDPEMLKVGPYPYSLKMRILGKDGHLSNEIAGKTIAHMVGRGTKRFILGHLSKENNFPELAYETVCSCLHAKNICPKKDISLEVALRDSVGRVVEL